MWPGNRLASERRQTVAKLTRAFFEIAEPLRPLGAIGDMDGLHGRGRVGRTDRVGVDVRIRLLTDGLDELGTRGDEPAIDTEGLAKRPNKDVDTGAAMFFRAPA